MITPSNKRIELDTSRSRAKQPDQFSYLLKEAFTTPPLTEEGLYRFKFALLIRTARNTNERSLGD